MHDILPDDQGKWETLEGKVRQLMSAYGYRYVSTPVLEHQDMFLRTVGEDSDIVQKELFTVNASGDREICMRPEGTVPTVRALAAGGLLRGQHQRVWYMGPMFRHERPQKGRLRQFHQFGAELLGQASHEAEAEIVLMCTRLWKELGIAKGLRLHVNNLGSLDERKAYGEALREYLLDKGDRLSPVDRARAQHNPLRVLDSKEEGIDEVLEEAPRSDEHIGGESIDHFEKFLRCLRHQRVDYKIDKRLVRGLDYYNLSVFEWLPLHATGRQSAVCGGGRYDGLLESLGSPPYPGTGMAAGMERIIELMKIKDDQSSPDVFFGMTGQAYNQKLIFELSERMRDNDISVVTSMRKYKISTFYKQADKSRARIALLIGVREKEDSSISMKLLSTGEQLSVPQDGFIRLVLEKLGRS